MIQRTCIAFVLLAAASLLAQQPDPKVKQDRAKKDRERMTTQMFMQQLMQIPHNRDMHAEIQLVEDQVKSLREITQSYQRRMMEFGNEIREDQQEVQRLSAAGDHEAAQKLGKSLQSKHMELVVEMVKESHEILLPHQIERLQQISKQQMARRANPFQDEFGVAMGLADELELTPAERQELAKTIARVRKKYYEEVAELKKQADQEILDAIPASKRKKLKDILGEKYDHEKQRRLSQAEEEKRREARRKQQRREQEESKAE